MGREPPTLARAAVDAELEGLFLSPKSPLSLSRLRDMCSYGGSQTEVECKYHRRRRCTPVATCTASCTTRYSSESKAFICTLLHIH
jgi:hypothetical protein